jgi:hypothetical protein
VANSHFIPTDDQERKVRILQSMSCAPQHVVISAFEGIRNYDPAEVAGGLAVPGLYIAADEQRPRSDMTRFHGMFPRFCTAGTPALGTSTNQSRSTR